jgi:spermidine synthase
MGGTIPILTQALARDLEDATRVHAFVYASNTAGAFAGALAGGFVLVPWLGLHNTVMVMGLVNVMAGAAFLLLGRHRMPVKFAVSVPHSATPADGFTVYALAAGLSGFAMMTLQMVLNRLAGLSFGSSHFTFAMVVGVFVLCIALGSFAVTAFPRISTKAGLLVLSVLVVMLALLYLPLQNAPYWAAELRRHFGYTDASFYLYHAVAFSALLAVFALPIGLSGAVLPLLFHAVRRQVQEAGAVAGRLYSWNTLGSVAGALFGGYLLLFWLDLHHVYRLSVAALAIAAVLLAVRLLSRAWAVVACGSAPLTAALCPRCRRGCR